MDNTSNWFSRKAKENRVHSISREMQEVKSGAKVEPKGAGANGRAVGVEGIKGPLQRERQRGVRSWRERGLALLCGYCAMGYARRRGVP